MEEKITKEFDRSIERMMNENTVAPPFGMWNRISADLDAIAPAAPVAAPLIPRGVLYGFIAGASLAGTLITGLLLFNQSGADKEVALLNTPAPVVVSPENKVSLAAIEKGEEIAKPVSPSIVANKTVEVKATAPVVEVLATTIVNDQKPQTDNESNLDNGNSVETIEAINISSEQTLLEMRAKQLEASVIPASTNAIDDEDDEDKKSKSSVTSYSEKKIKYKKRKSSRFSYGNINRVKRKF